MNWDALGAIGDFTGAIAVLVTLIYLVRQVRENTAAQQTTSEWMMTGVFNQTHLHIIEDSDFARILQPAQEGELADPTDRVRMRSFVITIMNAYASAWRSHKSGHLAKDSYQELVADTRILFAPGLLPFVKEDLEIRSKAFVRDSLPALAEDADTPFQPPLKS